MRSSRVRPARQLWGFLLSWRFRWFQRHRHDRLSLERIAGRPILVLPQVFNPKLFRTGAFLVETLSPELIPPHSTVLDMGTGSGIGAIFAARWARRVVAVDVNPAAVRCARINVLLNAVEEQVDVRRGDLFAPVTGEQFDVVLFNPPFLPGHPQDRLDMALRSEDVVERFAAGLREHLAPEGHALLVLSSDADVPRFLQVFYEHGFACAEVAQRDLLNETLTLTRLQS